ncbi:aminotransferase class V-fold PLP-dependent enzyme [Pseudonocardia acidicola]|uniref:Aminotransferase class V-fold PLP-dependent enzyme n=1 Tax=Pseudonocardia acidicola TaxID=2724939 RepID=A0ABX1SI90_9PSEU|nr:aminotransferase class V-fold PLP-dependent enzyme [Pseudonocardia acidicola]NMI01289.1 aminotransferase class V-fold PLP-dependent enzyme [Pseudonocardia acidicola]
MAFDVARVRGLIPALGDGWVHVDGTAGMHAPEEVAFATLRALRAPVSAPGGVFPASLVAEETEHAARQAVADLVGADPRGVVIGPGVAVLLRRLADALGETWILGDEIVLSRLDDVSNVTPWLRNAQRKGVGVRWAEIDIETCELPDWQFDDLLERTTRVVALTAASPHVGTRPDIPKIAERTRENGALLVVDISAAAPFGPQDIDALGADVVALDAAAWGGPRLGALVFRAPALLDRLASCSLEPAARGPRRLEVGPHSCPQLAGLIASIDHLAGLDDTAAGTRRERLIASMAEVKSYQAGLLATLLVELRTRTGALVIGDPMRRVPMLSFTHASVKAPDVVEHLADRGICAFADPGDHGVLAHLGSAEVGGVVRVGLAHYTNAAEVEALVSAVAELG